MAVEVDIALVVGVVVEEGLGLVVVVVLARGWLARLFCPAIVQDHWIEDVLAVTVSVSIFVCMTVLVKASVLVMFLGKLGECRMCQGAQRSWDVRHTLELRIHTFTLYIALHLNVPLEYESISRKLLNLAKGITFGMLAPEIVLLKAWNRWRRARTLTLNAKRLAHVVSSSLPTMKVRRLLVPQLGHEALRSFKQWSMPHIFMGGFLLDIERTSQVRDMLVAIGDDRNMIVIDENIEEPLLNTTG